MKIGYLLIAILFCSCDNTEENLKKTLISKVWNADSLNNAYSETKEWKDKHGIFHYDIIYHKSPLTLKFYQDSLVIEALKLQNSINIGEIDLGDVLHQRYVSGNRFSYEYEISKDSIITIDNGFLSTIKAKYTKDNKILWTLRNLKDTVVFISTQ
jgi:hypothetical protein